jgi:hypothetical protein
LSVTSVASVPDPMSSRAASLSFMSLFYRSVDPIIPVMRSIL